MKRARPETVRDRRGEQHRMEERRQSAALTLIFTAFVFMLLLAAIAVAFLLIYILNRVGVFSETKGLDTTDWLLLMGGVSLIFGGTAAFFAIRIPLRPMTRLISALNRLSSGDYSVRLQSDHAFDLRGAMPRQLIDSFNRTAEELENTELLREDFINNFSHEFKTPIVSISGFAKLLRSGNPTEEQRKEYIDVIASESDRLASMATHVLDLTRVENTAILTDCTSYNVSEQIRQCILLLEGKWTAKKIELELEFDEHTVTGNRELLQQVWMNLLDNAIRYTTVGGTVGVDITKDDTALRVTVRNTGSYIPPEERERIFRKFYQIDRSHSGDGNGIGLAVVRRIVVLHGGEISVESGDAGTAFTVALPL